MGNAKAGRSRPARVDPDYQLRHERVAGIDVAKAKADVSPAPAAARRRPGASRVEEVPARAREILDLAGGSADGVELVVMESTSDYWRIWFFLLESAGLAVQLVNSSHAGSWRGGRRPTGSTPSGSPGWRRWACCGRRSCRRRRSGRCAT